MGLWLFSFQNIQRYAAKLGKPPTTPCKTDLCRVDTIVWAVRAVTRYVPRATCLTQALASQILLSRRGHASRLHIGVARDEKEDFHAHSWLESQGVIVLGGLDVAKYSPLMVLDTAGNQQAT